MNKNLRMVDTYQEEQQYLVQAFLDAQALVGDRPLDVLEAGCGPRWVLDLGDLRVTLTGLDLDPEALRIRRDQVRDLDYAIHGDLAEAEIPASSYDVIYNSFVLEHVRGAERILDNFELWLRPGGYLLIRMPDRDSVYGFFSRVLPFSLHIAFTKYVQGLPNAGRPGYAPYATVYEPIVSRQGIRDWCARRGLLVQSELASHFVVKRKGWKIVALRGFVSAVSALSLGRLKGTHNNLTYILHKPLN